MKTFFIRNALKGMAMGIAEVIPGVSGGTIAFITGIYERLLQSIKSFSPKLFTVLKNEGFASVWKTIDGNFLLSLFTGMILGFGIFLQIITWLLDNHSLLLWAFFFGLILGSCLFIGKKINHWNIAKIILLICSASLAYYITITSPSTGSESKIYIFFCGLIAISALMLPGLSGSFMLLLMGMYRFILNSIKDLDFQVILTFGLGALIGVFSFAHVLTWAFKNYKDLTLTFMTGLMLGSLNKIWPWRHILSYRTNSHGEKVPFLESSVLPWNFNGDPKILFCLLLMFIGLISVMILEKFGDNKSNTFS